MFIEYFIALGYMWILNFSGVGKETFGNVNPKRRFYENIFLVIFIIWLFTNTKCFIS